MTRHPATIIRGRIVPDDLKFFRACCEAYRPGTRLWITISRRKEVSDPLRKYYYGLVLTLIQGHTGHGKDELHDFFKRHFLGVEKDAHGIEMLPSVFGNGSKLSHEDRVQFVDDVRYFASSKLDMMIPDPDPEWRKK